MSVMSPATGAILRAGAKAARFLELSDEAEKKGNEYLDHRYAIEALRCTLGMAEGLMANDTEATFRVLRGATAIALCERLIDKDEFRKLSTSNDPGGLAQEVAVTGSRRSHDRTCRIPRT